MYMINNVLSDWSFDKVTVVTAAFIQEHGAGRTTAAPLRTSCIIQPLVMRHLESTGNFQ